MLTIIIEYMTNLYALASAMALYIMIGVLFAGVLKQLIPDDFVAKHLGSSNFGSVFKASLFGIPLPLCSCSVIPFALSLKKEGASNGAVQSFLISTPITGVDSILATYGFFGWVFTLYRILSSLIIAMVAGLLQNMYVLKSPKVIEEIEPCCSDGSCSEGTNPKRKFSLIEVFRYAFVTIFKDFAKPLFWGLILGALLTTFMPKELASLLFENRYLTYVVILMVAIPLYVCATASLPIAAAFMMSGMSAGAAFIFLSAGPATNSVTMSVVYKSLGKYALLIYLGVIGLLSLLFGALYDAFMPPLDILKVMGHEEGDSWLEMFATMIMAGLILYYLITPLFQQKTPCCSGESCCDK